MNNIKVLSLILSLLAISCNKEIERVQDVPTLQEFGVVDEDESFAINTQQDTLVVTENGIGVFIENDSFVDEQGNPVSGEVQLVIKDVTTLSEMLGENISTQSPKGMLETRGMLKIDAYAAGKPLKLQNGKAIDLFFPGEDVEYLNADIYYGYKDADGVLKWTKGEKQEARDDRIDWGERNRLNFSITTDGRYGDVVEATGFGQEEDESIVALRNGLALSDVEKEILFANPVSVWWTLFSDGDFEVYHIEGNVPQSLKNKIERRLNDMPAISAFHRDGGAASVSGTMVIGAYVVENEILDNFSLRTFRLGWVNCDIFIRSDVPLVDMTVDAPSPYALMRLVFDDYRTVVSGVLKTDGKVYFSGIADGAKARLVSIHPEGDDTQLSVSAITIQKHLDAPTDFRVVGKQELEDILDSMID
ncbi:MAG: hypothetical protein AAFN81_15700 [Bacteroidota bacterium]